MGPGAAGWECGRVTLWKVIILTQSSPRDSVLSACHLSLFCSIQNDAQVASRYKRAPGGAGSRKHPPGLTLVPPQQHFATRPVVRQVGCDCSSVYALRLWHLPNPSSQTGARPRSCRGHNKKRVSVWLRPLPRSVPQGGSRLRVIMASAPDFLWRLPQGGHHLLCC